MRIISRRSIWIRLAFFLDPTVPEQVSLCQVFWGAIGTIFLLTMLAVFAISVVTLFWLDWRATLFLCGCRGRIGSCCGRDDRDRKTLPDDAEGTEADDAAETRLGAVPIISGVEGESLSVVDGGRLTEEVWCGDNFKTIVVDALRLSDE